MEEAFRLDPEDYENAQDIGGNTDDKCIKVEIPSNNVMTEFFEGSDTEELMQHMFVYTKTKLGTLECLRMVLS